MGSDAPHAKQPFKAYPIGYFHIDIAEVRTEEGRFYLFVAVDRTSKYAFARLMQKKTLPPPGLSSTTWSRAVPDKIHTVLTDNGIQFANLPKNQSGPIAMWYGQTYGLWLYEDRRACWPYRADRKFRQRRGRNRDVGMEPIDLTVVAVDAQPVFNHDEPSRYHRAIPCDQSLRRQSRADARRLPGLSGPCDPQY